jgi:hypothetical protein
MPLPNQGGGWTSEDEVEAYRGQNATDGPTPQANESKPGNAKANPCPNRSGRVPGHYS